MKDKLIREALTKACTNKVKVCTKTFCAYGCLDQDFAEDFMIRLNDVKVVPTHPRDSVEHKDSLLICDDNIVNFEPYINLD